MRACLFSLLIRDLHLLEQVFAWDVLAMNDSPQALFDDGRIRKAVGISAFEAAAHRYLRPAGRRVAKAAVTPYRAKPAVMAA